MKPIVLDLEMSGLDMEKCGIWQIGAIDLNTMEEYIDESRIDEEDVVEEGALKVIGKTEEELRDQSKQSQKEMIEKFMKWVESRQLRNFLCQNPQFDIGFLTIRIKKYGIPKTYHFRAFDLHSIAQTKYFELNNKFRTNDHNSEMNLTSVLELCGMPDNRINFDQEGEVVHEGNPHNALEDAKLTAECFSRIIEGKNLFPEYSKFEMPEELRK